MDLTPDEIGRACTIAALEVGRRIDRFKPANKPIMKDELGQISEQTFRGSVGQDVVYAFKLQWTYAAGPGGGHVSQIAHARLRCIIKDGGRFLRLVNLHIPRWDHGNSPTCRYCGKGFDTRAVVEHDPSLHKS